MKENLVRLEFMGYWSLFWGKWRIYLLGILILVSLFYDIVFGIWKYKILLWCKEELVCMFMFKIRIVRRFLNSWVFFIRVRWFLGRKVKIFFIVYCFYKEFYVCFFCCMVFFRLYIELMICWIIRFFLIIIKDMIS